MHKQIKLPQNNSSKNSFSKEILNNYSDIFLGIITNRGISTDQELGEYIKNRTKIDLSEVKLFDVQTAKEIIEQAVSEKQKILIYGDYDVDGITSTTILWRFLYHDLQADAVPFIPDRKQDGYGLNLERCRQLITEHRPGLLITVDCGVRDQEIISTLKSEFKELKIIITDHHQFPAGVSKKPVPAADALVHPLHPESVISPREICAAVVSWLLVQEFELTNQSKYLDLAALGTVCDLMPLVGLNRQIVKQGLALMSKSEIHGLRELITVAQIKDLKNIETYHLGYQIGPRINAAGRIGDPLDAVRLLSTKNPQTAKTLARKLNDTNQTRRDLTETAFMETLDSDNYAGENIILVKNADWEEGITGLIAGKLNQSTNKPTIALTRTGDGYWVGSARSNSKINITDLISRFDKILVKFGGHKQAAGLTIKDEHLEQFTKEISELALKEISAEQLIQDIAVDFELEPGATSKQLINEFELLAPFGEGNYKPRLLISNYTVKSTRKFGNNNQHIELKLEQTSKEGLNSSILWFNHEFDPDKHQQFITELSYNQYNGQETIQFIVKDYVTN